VLGLFWSNLNESTFSALWVGRSSGGHVLFRLDNNCRFDLVRMDLDSLAPVCKDIIGGIISKPKVSRVLAQFWPALNS